MSTPFQNRLVGTIMVAAVVIIFLPDILDGEKKSHQVEFEAIPKAKVFSGKLTNKPFPEERLSLKKETEISTETAIDDDDNIKVDIELKQNTQDIIKTAPPTIPKLVIPTLTKPKELPLPEKAVVKEAWVIHLGSFKNKENVAQLLAKLNAKGYIAFTKPIKTKQGVLTKVIIGPELIKSSMTKQLPALKTLTGIQGKVAYYSPIK